MIDPLPLISVIVPVYKVKKYLRKCVDSILAQTYTNLEIILVDDGSPDNCGIICDEYAAKDSRIKVIHQPNGGLSAARNAGLDIATGDYIGFVDSDDYIDPDMYEKLYNALIENDADVSICNYEYVDDMYQTMNVYSPMENKIYGYIEAINNLFVEYYCYYVTVWNRLYKSELLLTLRFEVNKKFEDAFIAHHIFLKCQKIVTIKDKLYYYLQRNDSIMGYKLSVSKTDELEAMFKRIKYLQRNCISIDFEKAERQFIDTYKEFKKSFIPKSKEEKKRIKEIDSYARIIYKQSKQIFNFKEHIIFNIIPIYPFIAKVKKSVYLFIKLLKFCLNQLFSDYVLLNLPVYGNLGDQAIAVAEIKLFNNQGLKALEVNEDLVDSVGDLFYKYLKKDKTVIICGGGFFGCLWRIAEEKYINRPIKLLPKNRIIVFPQTVTFDLDSESGKQYFKMSKEILYSHPDLTVFVREKKSLDFMKQYLPQVRTNLVPDIVLTLDIPQFDLSRDGIVFCLRTDKEKLLESEDALKKIIKEKYPDYIISRADNLVNHCIMPEDREKEVYVQLEKFASSKLVVTDRLHGMIFAAITATPCIAFDNSNGKVGSIYDEWLKDNEYIKFCKTEDDLTKALSELDLGKEYVFNNRKIKEGLKALEEVLNG